MHRSYTKVNKATVKKLLLCTLITEPVNKAVHFFVYFDEFKLSTETPVIKPVFIQEEAKKKAALWTGVSKKILCRGCGHRLFSFMSWRSRELFTVRTAPKHQ